MAGETTPKPIERAWKRPFLREAAFWLALVGACCAMFGGLALGAIPGGADNVLFGAPPLAIRWDGGLPLWDRWQASGSPFFDSLQAAALYPPRALFYLVEDWRGWFGPFCFAHHLVAFLGAGAFLRGLGFGRGAALIGAVVFAGGGGMAGRILNPAIFQASRWLPLLLAGAAGPERWRGWAMALAFAMICLAGSPHVMFYGLAGFGLVFLAAGLPKALEGAPDKLRTALKLIVARLAQGGLAVAVASPTLLPGVLRASGSLRAETTAADNLADSVAWGELPGAFLGGTAGGVFPEYIDKSCYVGAVALLLCAAAFQRRGLGRDGRFRAGAGLLLAGVAFALGENVGLRHVMPWIPGYDKLQGPARALILASAGLGVLAALGAENLRERRTLPLGLAAVALGSLALGWTLWKLGSAGDWLSAWAWAPRIPRGQAFLGLDAGAGLLLGGAVLLLPARFGRWREGLLLALIAAQLVRFGPRLQVETLSAEDFDAPGPVAWLADFQERHPGEPFRIAGFDPYRRESASGIYAPKLDFLYPKTSTLYGLEDIQGFDPLLKADYKALIERTSGRAPHDDPLRTLEINKPDERLFDLLNVRFILGHPRNRRLTNLPITLAPGRPFAEVEAWTGAGTREPVSAWLFVGLADGASGLPMGAEIARLLVEAEEGPFSFPVRLGRETADIRALNAPEEMLRRLEVRPHSRWSVPSPDPADAAERVMANWRGRIDFGRPLRIQSVAWELGSRPIALHVAGQGYRLAEPEGGGAWRLAFGGEDDLAPVFEYLPAKPRAALLFNAEVRGGEVALPEETLAAADASGGRIAWRERRTNGFALEVETDRPALLFLRERWAPGWVAEVDGHPAPVLKVGGLFRGVALEPGTHEVRFAYRPGLFFGLLWVAGAALLAGLGWAARDVRAWRATGR